MSQLARAAVSDTGIDLNRNANRITLKLEKLILRLMRKDQPLEIFRRIIKLHLLDLLDVGTGIYAESNRQDRGHK